MINVMPQGGRPFHREMERPVLGKFILTCCILLNPELFGNETT
jgi:hypothetical protein